MTRINPWMCPEGAQVELLRERCVTKVLKFSSELNECKPLPLFEMGTSYRIGLSAAAVVVRERARAWARGVAAAGRDVGRAASERWPAASERWPAARRTRVTVAVTGGRESNRWPC